MDCKGGSSCWGMGVQDRAGAQGAFLPPHSCKTRAQNFPLHFWHMQHGGLGPLRPQEVMRAAPWPYAGHVPTIPGGRGYVAYLEEDPTYFPLGKLPKAPINSSRGRGTPGPTPPGSTSPWVFHSSSRNFSSQEATCRGRNYVRGNLASLTTIMHLRSLLGGQGGQVRGK